jgi:Spy/CpxP family protein refolding chaperone
MVRLVKMATVCVLAASLVSTVVAQDQKREQGQGRRPGGGFGGGFGGAIGGGFGATGLLAMPEVQKELGLNDEQKTKLQDLVNDLRQQAGGRGGVNFQELQNLSDEERQKRMDEFRKRAEEAAKKANETIAKILDAKQNDRYGQLQLQREGVAAIARAEIADKLNLTKEQKEKVAKIQEEGRSALRGGGAGFGQLSDEERREAFTKAQAAREKVTTDLAAVLTADQKASWEKMLGANFEFPQRGFGGGRPGGGEGGGDRKRPETKK